MKRAKNPPMTKKKLGPGEYRPDVAFQRVEDLPRPRRIPQDWNSPHLPCPACGRPAGRDRVFTRVLHDIGDLVSGRPRDLHLTYSQHYCSRCGKYFRADQSALAPPGSHYTWHLGFAQVHRATLQLLHRARAAPALLFIR